MKTCSINIRIAEASDFDMLVTYDKHIKREDLLNSILSKHVLILESADIFAGWLRWNLFWDSIPIMNMLYLLEPFRRKGLGRELVMDWERRVKTAGYSTTMTSTQSDEEAQHFYRKLGYTDCGCLYPDNQIATEIFLRKTI